MNGDALHANPKRKIKFGVVMSTRNVVALGPRAENYTNDLNVHAHTSTLHTFSPCSLSLHTAAFFYFPFSFFCGSTPYPFMLEGSPAGRPLSTPGRPAASFFGARIDHSSR